MHKKGFTLLELLVVVLIIGILASVALPQYKIAVAKSRIATVTPLMNTIRQAEESYYMANGVYTPLIGNLDVSFTPEAEINSTFKLNDNFRGNLLGNLTNKTYVQAVYCPGYGGDNTQCNNHDEFAYFLWLTHSESPNAITCRGYRKFGKKVCKSLCGSESCNVLTKMPL